MPTILYSFRRCPYAIRARMALLRAAVSVELREVALRDKPAALLALSAKATVPLLHCADGSVIDESLAIMDWALRRCDPERWLRDVAETDNRRLIDVNDGTFKRALDRYKYAERHPERTQAAHRADAEAALLEDLEARLQRARFLGGDTACLADVAIFPFVRQFAAVDGAWFEASHWASTRRWLNHWLTSPQFELTMGRFAPWAPGQKPLLFGSAVRAD